MLEATDREEWVRHPSDLARLIFYVLLIGLLGGLVAVGADTMRAASRELVQLMAELPAGVRAFLAGTAQLLTVVAPVVLVGFGVWRRRFRELALVAGSALVAAVVMLLAQGMFDGAEPIRTLEDYRFESWLTDASFPSVVYLAGLTAAITAASPMVDRAWRRAGVVAIGSAVLVRLLTATQAPSSLVLTVLVGAAAASLVLVVFGAPARRPGADRLREAARRAGVTVGDLQPTDASGSVGRSFAATAGDGTEVILSYVDGDERDADLLFRAWRALRVKGIEDTATGVSPESVVGHAAMMSMLAANNGVSTAEVLGVSSTDRGGAVLITRRVEGTSLAALSADELDDGALASVWDQLSLLHAGRIAHRQLDADHVTIDRTAATLRRFRWAVPAAEDALLAIDVADLLVATALVVGPERAVAAAGAAIGPESLAEALPFLQPLALATGNKRLIRKNKALLGEVTELVTSRSGVDEVELAELDRIGLQQIVAVFGFAVLAFFVLGLIDNWSDIVDVLTEADWTDVPIMIVLVLLTNVAGAASLMGAVTRPLPLGDTSTVMFGQSFLNRFTPANAGGMAMRIRYLQKGGTDLTVATASVGLTSVASGIVQGIFILVFVTWAGTVDTGVEVSSPPWRTIAIVVGLVVASILFVLAVPRMRRWALRVVRQSTDKIRDEFADLMRRPGKLALLFGGAAVSKLLTIAVFILACRAFDIDIATAQLASGYMVATTIASAVPTPGGVGAIEAALVLTLTGMGVDQAVAWSATLLFRLISYWMPIIPGAIGLKLSRSRDLV